jgi:hypothetical protein
MESKIVGRVSGKIKTDDIEVDIGEAGFNTKVRCNGKDISDTVTEINIHIKAGEITTMELKTHFVGKGGLYERAIKLYDWIGEEITKLRDMIPD